MNASTIREMHSIQRRLDTWELEHLREHALALHLQLEELKAEVEALKAEAEQLRNEAYASDARADMFLSLNNELQEQTGARIGITREGFVGVLQ